eukprot:GHVP01061651.1.p1 GENE.GHVP01061651.1~~GHVP01061651.1.p1  ORF type:complete len:194 (+),score=34.32 GHVP01061651.1:459-1040(+)
MKAVKLLMVGDSGVGKSCILLRFCDDEFTPCFISTIGIDFKMRRLTVGDKTVELQIWDTAGQERFRTITSAYYRGSMGIVLAYDITVRRSFENITRWIDNIRSNAPAEVCIILVGNKCDSDNDRAVSVEEGQKLAEELGVSFLEASAKECINVDETFLTLTEAVLSTFDFKEEEEEEAANILSEEKQKSKWCC